MTTTEQKQKQEMVLPSFFYAIASSESRQLISLDELQRIITLDAMTQARTEDYRKNMRISSELAHQTKVMMPGITTSVLMDGRGKELRNVVKTTQMIAVDIDKDSCRKDEGGRTEGGRRPSYHDEVHHREPTGPAHHLQIPAHR